MSNTIPTKRTLLTECNIYLFLWMLYFLQGSLYNSGGLFSQSILAILLIISVVNTLKVNTHSEVKGYLKGLNALLIMFTVYGLISIISGREISKGGDIRENYIYLKSIYISLLPIYSLYYYTIKGELEKENLKKWILIFFILSTVGYFYEMNVRLAYSLGEESTVNAGYTMLSLMPLIVLWKDKPYLQYILLGFIMILTLMSMKRGAIIVGAICIMWFLLKSIKYASKRTKAKLYVLTALVSIAGIYAVQYLLENSSLFIQRIEQTEARNSSGRDFLYNTLWNSFINQDSISNFFFGRGADATILIAGNYAHNDWLEILTNNGLIGAIIYLFYWISFYKEWRMSKDNNDLYMILGMLLLIYFIATLFSMSYNNVSIYAACGLGYALGCKHSQYYS